MVPPKDVKPCYNIDTRSYMVCRRHGPLCCLARKRNDISFSTNARLIPLDHPLRLIHLDHCAGDICSDTTAGWKHTPQALNPSCMYARINSVLEEYYICYCLTCAARTALNKQVVGFDSHRGPLFALHFLCVPHCRSWTCTRARMWLRATRPVHKLPTLMTIGSFSRGSGI